MIKDSVIDNLENLGFRIDFTLECARFYDGCGRLCGEVFVSHPTDSWIGGKVLQMYWSAGANSELDSILELIAHGSGKGYMPDLFILKTDAGFVKRGESLGFTQSDPTLFTKKQLDRVRLRVAALNPITYKVN